MSSGTDLHAKYREIWPHTTITQLVRDGATNQPQQLCAADSGRRLSYQEMWQRCCDIAAYFAAAGVEPGDKVILQLPNAVSWLETFLGLIECGAVVVMATDSLRTRDLERIARAAEANHICTPSQDNRYAALSEAAKKTSDTLAGIGHRLNVHEIPTASGISAPTVEAKAASDRDPSDAVVIQIGGARCDAPLLIERHHEDYLCSVELSNDKCGVQPTDVLLVSIPASHNYTMASPGILGMLMANASIVFAPDPTPNSCSELFDTFPITLIALVPSLMQMWLDARDTELASADMTTIFVGGSPMDLDLARQLQLAFDANIQEVYGMAEGLVAYSPLDLDRDANPDTHELVPMSDQDEIRIIDPATGTDLTVTDGVAAGELLCRGPYTVTDFKNCPPSAQGLFDQDGWYHSGDLACVHYSDGTAVKLTITGRTKPQINRSAEKIFPGDLVTLLEAHPHILTAQVYGVADPVLGEAIHADITARIVDGEKPLKTLALRRYLHGCGIASYAMPDAFTISYDNQ